LTQRGDETHRIADPDGLNRRGISIFAGDPPLGFEMESVVVIIGRRQHYQYKTRASFGRVPNRTMKTFVISVLRDRRDADRSKMMLAAV